MGNISSLTEKQVAWIASYQYSVVFNVERSGCMLNIDYEYKDLAYGFDSVAAMHIYLSTALMRKAKGIDAEALGNSKRIEYLAQAYEKMAQVERIKQKIAFAMKGNLISEGKSCLEQYAKMEIELNDILTKNGLEVPWAGNEQ